MTSDKYKGKKLSRYVLENGHELFVNKSFSRGMITTMFGCARCEILDCDGGFIITTVLLGRFSPEECIDWILAKEN